MDRVEFLAILRESLEGYIPNADVEENITFYRNYFQEAGMPEREVIEELGDPRLIARTIIQAYKASKGPMADYYEEQARSEYSQSRSWEYGGGREAMDFGEKKEGIKRWILLGGFFLLFLLVLGVLLAVVGAIIMYLLPILVVIFVVKLLLDYFER